MKELLIAKRIDLFLQLLALLIPAAYAFAIHEAFPVFYAYFSVGGVQVLSCILNKIGLDSKLKHGGRQLYEKLLLGIILVAGSSFLLFIITRIEITGVPVMLVAVLLLFFSPLMVIWYAVMTYDELVAVRRLMDRRVI